MDMERPRFFSKLGCDVVRSSLDYLKMVRAAGLRMESVEVFEASRFNVLCYRRHLLQRAKNLRHHLTKIRPPPVTLGEEPDSLHPKRKFLPGIACLIEPAEDHTTWLWGEFVEHDLSARRHLNSVWE